MTDHEREEYKRVIVGLNRVIMDAHRVIQNGGDTQQVWNALYIHPDLKVIVERPPVREDAEEMP